MTSNDDLKRAEEYRWPIGHESSMYEPCKFYDRTGATSFEDLVERAYLAGLEEGRRSQWVKCSERMPESDGYYLVWPCGKYHGHEVQFATVGFNSVPADSFFYETEDSYDTSYHPVQPEYWMPLPPPPVEDSKS